MGGDGPATRDIPKLRGILWGFIFVALALWVFWPDPPIQRIGPDIDPVARTFEVNSETAHGRLETGLQSELVRTVFPYVEVILFGEPESGRQIIAPGQLQLEPHTKDNPGLTRYATRPATERMRDFYVTTVSHVWHTEYTRGGESADFSTDFLIQIDPLAEERTRVEIVEYAPYILGRWRGRACGRHLVPEIWREKIPVEPTTRDRQQVLDAVTKVIEQQR